MTTHSRTLISLLCLLSLGSSIQCSSKKDIPAAAQPDLSTDASINQVDMAKQADTPEHPTPKEATNAGKVLEMLQNQIAFNTRKVEKRADDWLAWNTLGFDVTIENESEAVAGLAVQGPTSCTVLTLLGCTDLNQLKPFGIAHYSFEGRPLMVSRTGFTGDLGYEVWVPPESAEALWDQLFELGRDYLIKPIGSHALELARIEAGFLQANVDFMPAEEVVRVGRTRSPFELGLSWLVDFKKPLFNGRSALLKEQEKGSRYRFAMLDVEGNKPAEHSFILKGDKQVGTVTSAAWCPTAKANIAYAQIEMPYGAVGDELVAEIYYQRELHWTRLLAPCKVIDAPIFKSPKRWQTPAPAH